MLCGKLTMHTLGCTADELGCNFFPQSNKTVNLFCINMPLY